MKDRFIFKIRYRCGGCNSINTRYVDWNPIESMINHECEHCAGASWIEEILSEEQCTGLRDKNSTLLFENEIVRDWYGRIMVIVWRNKPDRCVQGQYNFKAIVNPMRNFKYAEFNPWWDYKNQCLDVEKIGNIHENPELLEQQ